LFFCLSSRRRHTRSKRDWSSDVCSSDLIPRKTLAGSAKVFAYLRSSFDYCRSPQAVISPLKIPLIWSAVRSVIPKVLSALMTARSEERRVGKECGGQWGTGESCGGSESG